MQKKKIGRPPLPEHLRKVRKSMRLPPHLWEKIRKAGLPAFRTLLEEWEHATDDRPA